VNVPGLCPPKISRDFQLRAFRRSRLHIEVDYTSRGYSRGDRLTALLRVRRAEGGVPGEGSTVVVSSVPPMEWSESTIKV